MKRLICIFLLLLGTVLFAVSCTDDSKEIERENVPTKTEESTKKSGLGIGVDTADGWGPLSRP